MIDLHTHLLPGLDDGPPTLAESLELARAAVARGTRVMAATPHVNPGYRLTPARITAATEAFRDAVDEAGIPLEVRSGGEISHLRLPRLDEDDLASLRLGGGPYLLIECPFEPDHGEFEPLVLDLLDRGHGVLLAHPERSLAVHRDPGLLARLEAAGALAQVTAGSLVGEFGRSVRRGAIELVREGRIHVAASDAHDAHHRRPGPGATLEEAAEALPELRELTDWLTREVPEAILAGAPVPDRPVRAA